MDIFSQSIHPGYLYICHGIWLGHYRILETFYRFLGRLHNTCLQTAYGSLLRWHYARTNCQDQHHKNLQPPLEYFFTKIDLVYTEVHCCKWNEILSRSNDLKK